MNNIIRISNPGMTFAKGVKRFGYFSNTPWVKKR